MFVVYFSSFIHFMYVTVSTHYNMSGYYVNNPPMLHVICLVVQRVLHLGVFSTGSVGGKLNIYMCNGSLYPD